MSSGKTYEGKGGDIHAAVKDAWENGGAKKDHDKGGEFQVEIRVKASNPVDGYVAVLRPFP